MLYQRKTMGYLIALVILINALGLFVPLLRNDDPALYANIAKHMAESNNWVDLISGRQDWLDKPHFPFWLTALSFKLLGITSFAYSLPGFLFHLLGAYYTYRLGKHLYNSATGLVAVLIYVSSLHLLLSATDVRAEAYLLGEIMPACYYWLIYDRQAKFKALLFASIFTALAMMTKGLFVVTTIFSGVVFSWLYTRQYLRIISPKWLVAYAMCLLFILPELICLYLQFDAHPEKVIFAQNKVSGLSWYFWGSQFGRFFNSGPIVHKNGNPFFYFHTYLWAFLPWSLVFIAASYAALRNFKCQLAVNKAKLVYLLASFWLTFLMFSASKFQLDYYTNILMPFAAILCANYLLSHPGLARMAKLQRWLSLLMVGLAIFAGAYLFKLTIYSCILIIPLSVFVFICIKSKLSYLEQILVYSSLAIVSVFSVVLLINGVICKQYDVGYNLAQIINSKPLTAVYDLNVNWVPLEFHVKMPYYRVDLATQLPESGAYYVVLKKTEWLNNYSKLNSAYFKPINSFCGNTIDKVLPYFANQLELTKHLDCFMVVEHVNH